MKIFFDTNVYIAEALLGAVAERLLAATQRSSWRIFISEYVLDELERVMIERLDATRRFAFLTRQRARRRAFLVDAKPESRHEVAADPHDSPVLRAALAARVDYLVTNDTHLLDISPYEGLRVISMTDYYHLLMEHGILT